MAHLGTFGTVREQRADTFAYFGTDIRINASVSPDLALTDFVDDASSVNEDDPRALLSIKRFMQDLVHEDDFDTFWALARRNGQTVEDLAAVAKALLVAVSKRPTRRPSGSSGGPRRTRTKSAAGSSSTVLDRLEGRPDLQLAVVTAQEAKTAQTG
jgi:hypothetical protein